MPNWPELDFPAFAATGQSLHMWTQIVGKFRLANSPWVNHSWQVPLYVDARGLTTSLVPTASAGFEVRFDFLDHRLDVLSTDGARETVPLQPMSVADFHAAFIAALETVGAPTRFHGSPNEVPDPVPFVAQTGAGDYAPEHATAFWQAMVDIDRVFTRFRSGFLGKVSPVHFFWGSFDLAVTRFSGRTAPSHPGGFPALPDNITREAYSHEVSSAGFWPGGNGIEEAMFFSYAYPTPDGFAKAAVEPGAAYWHDQLSEFVLPYAAVRAAEDPDAALMAFLDSTYRAAADLAGWDRSTLECAYGEPGVPRAI
ncbi:MAG: DUF5996 family protein [Phyllobacteriaceae bacterium]|jgi:hypothetical protein|nr:DUF5996 family protein [Phyllobacteriaceae bacterium]